MGVYDELSQIDDAAQQDGPETENAGALDTTKAEKATRTPTKPPRRTPERGNRTADRTVREKAAAPKTAREAASPEGRQALSVLKELELGVRDDTRPTERYSFEIYSDMKDSIYQVQHRYKMRTGGKLSASRVIREALERYLEELAIKPDV